MSLLKELHALFNSLKSFYDKNAKIVADNILLRSLGISEAWVTCPVL